MKRGASRIVDISHAFIGALRSQRHRFPDERCHQRRVISPPQVGSTEPPRPSWLELTVSPVVRVAAGPGLPGTCAVPGATRHGVFMWSAPTHRWRHTPPDSAQSSIQHSACSTARAAAARGLGAPQSIMALAPLPEPTTAGPCSEDTGQAQHPNSVSPNIINQILMFSSRRDRYPGAVVATWLHADDGCQPVEDTHQWRRYART